MRASARRATWVLMLALCLAGAASAQTFPTKQVRWVVPFPPGGATDVVVRLISPKFSERLGQPVIVENIGGAGGNIGHEAVARSKPDGYTLLYAIPAVVLNPFYYKVAVDPAEFAGVIQTTALTSVLLASNSFAPKTVAEIITLVRAKPGTVSCGQPGSLPAVGCELLKTYAGDMILVPYKASLQR